MGTSVEGGGAAPGSPSSTGTSVGSHSCSGSCLTVSSSVGGGAGANCKAGVDSGRATRGAPSFPPPSLLVARSGSKSCTFDGSCFGLRNAANASLTFDRMLGVRSPSLYSAQNVPRRSSPSLSALAGGSFVLPDPALGRTPDLITDGIRLLFMAPRTPRSPRTGG